MDSLQQGKEEKMNEITEHWKRKLIELDEKIRKSEAELEESQNLKLKGGFEEPELNEKISYLKEWIDFHLKEKIKYEAKLKSTEEAVKANEAAVLEKGPDAFNLIFGGIEEEKPKADAPEAKTEEKVKAEEKPVKEAKIGIWDISSRIKDYQPLFKYALSFALLIFIIGALFFIKPEITGHVVLSKETTQNDNLNLRINESGNYTWDLGKPVDIKSIKAAGSIIGNGSVKIYIEKDGKRYLIYNKE